MDDARMTRISKFLSKRLRHEPERLGLQLQPGGWVAVETLLAGCARAGFPLTRAELDEVVARNSKRRFSFDDTGALIRANQGHSVEIDLQLEPVTPPDMLYHGTGHRNVETIIAEGLKKMSRHHVHLSGDIATAKAVGSRHGKPVIFEVDAAAMRRDGFTFYCSANGVWLVESVPPQYLRRMD
ncbi:MAG TPA: RNA 2'-phosphotransferase [Blastocatellia bacterium]|nr:RNA 2'-phosphotransferase [Blastocatellia bacterium]